MTGNNGISAVADLATLDLPKVEPAKSHRTYITKSGAVLELRPVSSVLIQKLKRDTFGKPKPPIVESEVGPRKVKVKEPNSDDPEYKEALAEWENGQNEKALKYIFTRGIVNVAPEEDVERLQSFFPGDNADGIKFAWLLEVLADDEDEISNLVRVITGQTVPTEKGISEAEERFRSDGERQSDTELSATEE